MKKTLYLTEDQINEILNSNMDFTNNGIPTQGNLSQSSSEEFSDGNVEPVTGDEYGHQMTNNSFYASRRGGMGRGFSAPRI